MTDDNPQQRQMAKINRALGIFLLGFAGVVLISILFTGTFIGRMTNLVAGTVIGGIGAAMVLKAGYKSP